MVVITVESKLRLRKKYLPDEVLARLKAKATYTDPVYVLRRRQKASTEGLTRYIQTWDETDRDLLLWRGSLGSVVRVLKAAGIEHEIEDQRLWLPKIDLSCQIKLRDYQEPGVAKMIKRQQTVIRAACGCGKTEMLLKTAAHFQQPTLVLVWQERQQKNWVERIPPYFGFWPGGVGGAFTKPVLDAPIVIGMINSVRNRLADLKYRFGCVICDEVDRFAAPTLRECVNEFPAAVRLGASDDERRRDEREFLLYDTFGPRGWRLKENPECPVEIILVPTKFEYSRGDIQNMMYEWTGVVDEFIEDTKRSRLALDLACREVDEGRRVLIWSDRVDHCEWFKAKLLARGYKAGLLIGGKKHKPECDKTEAGLRDGSVEVGIGTSVAEKAINIPPLDVGIMTCASAGRKPQRFKQMRGRLARPHEGKEKATLYYLFDSSVPKLKKKKYNIRSLYQVKEMRHPHKNKESGTMADAVALTVETLKAGCKQLGIKVPKGATAKKLKKLIEKELAKNKTYGSYTCGACFQDIVDKLSVCPFCQAKFKPVAEEEPEDEELEGDEDEEEDEDELEDEDDEGEEEDEEDEEDEGEEDDEGEEEDEEDEEGEEDDEEEDEDEEDEEDEEEPPKKKKKGKAKGKAKKETAAQKSKAKAKAAKKAKEAEKEAKREQIRSELPYKAKALKAMKRTTLVMIAGVLGIKNPVKLGTAEEMVKAIVKVQKTKFKDKGKKKGKDKAKGKKKAASKKGKKAKSKKKKAK